MYKMKKKIATFFLALLLSISSIFGQCFPDFIYTSLGFPGVFPPPIAIPNSPVPLGISDGVMGQNYNQTLTFVVLEDTTLDIGFLLPSSVVSAMNAAGISTVMNVDVNHVTFSIQGLPSGLSTQCDQINCQYPSSIDGCMLINGIPTQSGNFSIPVSMLINIQIPAITDPIFGTTLFPATPIDLPSFTVNQYDLFIADGVLSVNETTLNSTIIMKSDLNSLSVQNIYPRNVNLYNSLGQLILSKMSVKIIDIGESMLNSGVYFVKIYDDFNSETHKFIIK